MLTLFWGAEVLPGKPQPFVPPPEAAKLRLTQASLSAKAAAGTKVTLNVKVGEDGPTLQLAVLREDRCENINLDVLFDQYSEFTVEGNAPVHIMGYLCPDGEEDPDGGPYSLDDIMEMQQMGMLPGVADEDDGDEEDEDDDDEAEEDDEMGDGFDSEDDIDGIDMGDDDDTSIEEDSTEEDSEDGDEPQSHTIIEEIPEDVPPKTKETKALPAPKRAAPDAKKQDSNKKPKVEAKKEPEQPAKGAAQLKKGADVATTTKKEAAPTANNNSNKKQATKTPPTPNVKDANGAAKPAGKAAKPKVRKYDNGFIIEEVAMGQPDGKLASKGKRVAVQYTGRLASNNKVFDASKGKPFRFRLGVGEVVTGFDRGVEGMRVGDKRRVTIPPQMGYGASGAGKAIPPNATLVFDLELVDVK